MKQKLIIVKIKLPNSNKDIILSSLWNEKQELIQVSMEQAVPKKIAIGSIYIGKVKNIIKNIDSAFVEIQDKNICYLSRKEEQYAVYTNPKKENILHIGDELLVQVIKENIKTKAPVVSAYLNFTGKYLVLIHGKQQFRFSKKIKPEEKTFLIELLQPYLHGKLGTFGFIIRTNAAKASKEQIQKEAQLLIEHYEEVIQKGIYKSRFSCIEQGIPSYLCNIRDGYSDELTEIITDDLELYKQIEQYIKTYQEEDLVKLKFYKDSFLSLAKLYGIEGKLKKALQEKVWLKSGGYLVIQPTEAFTVIDVNTGKAISGKKKAEETFYQINREAAVEIGVQLRLRNISGIIIIDFINMETKEYQQHLVKLLKETIQNDPVKTTFVDITQLNLVELTRKKMKKPLLEQYRELIGENKSDD